MDLMPLLSMLFFLSGSTFSPWRLSLLGRRLAATEGFRDMSVRELLRGKLVVRAFRGRVSAKLDSVTSRMSDNGRGFAHEEAMECPLCSPRWLPSVPLRAMIWPLSDAGEARKEEILARSGEG